METVTTAARPGHEYVTDGSVHCIRRGSGKPKLVYPGARLVREEASTPVAMSW
jgi:hypothetical protein